MTDLVTLASDFVYNPNVTDGYKLIEIIGQIESVTETIEVLSFIKFAYSDLLNKYDINEENVPCVYVDDKKGSSHEILAKEVIIPYMNIHLYIQKKLKDNIKNEISLFVLKKRKRDANENVKRCVKQLIEKYE